MTNQNTINSPKSLSDWQSYHQQMTANLETAKKKGDLESMRNLQTFVDLACRKIAELVAKSPAKASTPATAPTTPKPIKIASTAAPATAAAPTAKPLSADDWRESIKPKVTMRRVEFMKLDPYERNEVIRQKIKLID